MIELLVVIAIIALLLSIITPALRGAKEQARKTVRAAHVKSLLTVIYVYAAKNNDNIPAGYPGNNATWNFICWQAFEEPACWINLGHLYGTDVIDDPEIFYCPSQKNKILQNYHSTGWDWKSPTGNEERAISYMYGLLAEIRAMPQLELESTKLVDLKKRALICDVFEPFEEGPVWAHPKGLTTGFGAGHVEFIKVDKEVIDVAAEMDESYGRTRNEMDLFVAAMFELLAGKKQVMEQEFL